MGTAYTPGLKVTENELLRKRRILPLKGEVLVENDSAVKHGDVVARTFLPGKVHLMNVANKLGIDQADVPNAMLKKEGDKVKEGDILAKSSSFFGLFKSQATASAEGTIESISGITGQVVLRGDPEPVEVMAYVDGKVIEVVPEEGVVVESVGTFIQGIFGVGGETVGELVMACKSPGDVLEPAMISDKHSGKIVVGGSLVTHEALAKAIKTGVKGVIVGGFDDQDLRAFLGYDLGVAITGHESLGITLIVTEGFGQIDMAPRTFKLLAKHEGELASINGATQIRAGVIRPEVIIPHEGAKAVKDEERELGVLKPGSPIRVIRAPHFGSLGKVSNLPAEPVALESGSKARVAEVTLESGETIVIPRANLERIEE